MSIKNKFLNALYVIGAIIGITLFSIIMLKILLKTQFDFVKDIYDIIYFVRNSISEDEEKYNRYIDLGSKEFEKKNYTKSIEYLEKAIELDPDTKEVNDILGISYFLINNKSKSYLFLLKAVQDNSENFITYAYLGWIQFERKEFIEAEKNFKKSLDIQKTPLALCGLGRLYNEQWKYNEANKYFNMCLEYNYPLQISGYLLGLVYSGKLGYYMVNKDHVQLVKYANLFFHISDSLKKRNETFNNLEFASVHFCLAASYSFQEHKDSAFYHFIKSSNYGSTEAKEILIRDFNYFPK